MKPTINILDLFSGIGGFTKGFEGAGYTIGNHYFSEIDKHAIANYKYNFKNAEYVGPIENVSIADLGRIDVLTFGSPCQDFSLAGQRKGLDGDRSSLILEAIKLVSQLRPRVFLWENVKGAFSTSDGADFWAVLQAFTNIGNYRLEWQLLNTLWFLPQNRERIYLIGHLAGRSRSKVFPIEENDELFKTTDQSNQGSKQTENFSTTLTGDSFRATNTFIQIGRIIGRNPENPKARVVGQPHEQMLEINEKGISNTLSTVQKDNVVISSFTRDKKGKVINRNDRNFCNTITSATGGGGSTDVFVNNVRRLTEIECERLQGFPDNWTQYGDYNGVIKTVPATHRYKMLGNAVTVAVVKEIATRLELT